MATVPIPPFPRQAKKRAYVSSSFQKNKEDPKHCVTDSDTMWMKFTLVKNLILCGIIFGCAQAQNFVDNFACPDEFEGYYPHLYSYDR